MISIKSKVYSKTLKANLNLIILIDSAIINIALCGHVDSVYDAPKKLGVIKVMVSINISQTILPHISYIYLALLFNSMFVHGVLPDEMLLGTIMSIMKNRLQMMIQVIFIAITLNNTLGKMFDNIISKITMH